MTLRADALDQMAQARPLRLQVKAGNLPGDDCLAPPVEELGPLLPSGLLRQECGRHSLSPKYGKKAVERRSTDRELLHARDDHPRPLSRIADSRDAPENVRSRLGDRPIRVGDVPHMFSVVGHQSERNVARNFVSHLM